MGYVSRLIAMSRPAVRATPGLIGLVRSEPPVTAGAITPAVAASDETTPVTAPVTAAAPGTAAAPARATTTPPLRSAPGPIVPSTPHAAPEALHTSRSIPAIVAPAIAPVVPPAVGERRAALPDPPSPQRATPGAVQPDAGPAVAPTPAPAAWLAEAPASTDPLDAFVESDALCEALRAVRRWTSAAPPAKAIAPVAEAAVPSIPPSAPLSQDASASASAAAAAAASAPAALRTDPVNVSIDNVTITIEDAPAASPRRAAPSRETSAAPTRLARHYIRGG